MNKSVYWRWNKSHSHSRYVGNKYPRKWTIYIDKHFEETVGSSNQVQERRYLKPLSKTTWFHCFVYKYPDMTECSVDIFTAALMQNSSAYSKHCLSTLTSLFSLISLDLYVSSTVLFAHLKSTAPTAEFHPRQSAPFVT